MLKRFIFRVLLPVIFVTATLQSPVLAENNFWVDQASSGSPRAQYNLARMYLWGMKELNIPQNDKEAYKWFLQSAEQGFAAAQYEVGLSLQDGRGITRDPQAAQVWFKKASDQGYAGGNPSMSRKTGSSAAGDHPGSSSTAIPPGELLSLAGDLTLESISHAIMNVKFFSGWWTWWLGAFALGFVTIGFWLTNRVTLGVSSSWDRIVGWREDADLAKADALIRATPADDLAAALMAETLAEFGDEVSDSMKESLTSDSGGAGAPVRTERTRWTVHVTFLTANVIGGFLAYALAGNWQLHMDMGAEYTSLFGSGPEAMVVLFMGGILVGFGTRLGGGCTSGHGLSGCSRLQRGSLVGTASFFGTAIAVSFLIDLFLG